MKKRLLAVVMSLVLAMGLVACGSKESSGNSDAERIAELEKELEELKAQQAEGVEEIVEEQIEPEEETWTDDTIIAFANAEMADAVRQITGIYDRDITAGDVKGITTFDRSWSGNLEPLKYFTGLTELKLVMNHEFTNLDAIKGLTNIKKLSIDNCTNVTDISAIGNLINLQDLFIQHMPNVTDFSAISNLKKIENITIVGIEVEELEIPSGLSNLSYLNIFLIGKIDLNGLSDADNLKNITLECNQFIGIEVLDELTNVNFLKLKGDGINNLEFISNYTSLVGLHVESSTLNIEESLSYLQKYENVWRDGENGIHILSSNSSMTETETCYKLW